MPGRSEEKLSYGQSKIRPDNKGKQNLQNVCFIDSIPGEDDEEGLVVLLDGSLRKYIKCEGINALLFDANDREQIAKRFAYFANTCESDVQIIVRSLALPVDEFLQRNQSKNTTENDYLNWYSDYTEKWFRRVQDIYFVPQREFYVVVTYQPPALRSKDSGKKSSARSKKLREKNNLHDLAQLTKSATEQLRAASLRPKILTRKEVRDLIYSQLNPGLVQREPNAPKSIEGKSEASILAASSLKVSEQHIWLDGQYVATQSLKQLPQETWMGWLVDLLTLTAPYTLSMFIHPHPVKNLGGSDKPYDISLYVSTHCESTERLAKQTDDIRRVFSNRNATLDRAQLTQLSAWQSTLCVAVDKCKVIHRVDSTTLGTFWPFFTASCGTPDGTPFGFAIASRQPVLLNPFYRGAGKDANNMLIVGSAGSGKSFAMSMLILRLLPRGNRFVIVDKTIDKASGYRFMTELLGEDLSEYVDLGAETAMTLNPFDLCSKDRFGKPSAEKISSLLNLFDLMFAPEGHAELSLREKARLDELIRAVYALSAESEKPPTMSDFYNLAARAATDESDPTEQMHLQTLVRAAWLFTKQGPFGSFLDGQTNFDHEKPFLVFDTRELNDPRLERVAQSLLADFIRGRAVDYKRRGVKFGAVIDQAVTWMRTRTGAILLDDLSRQSRQYGMMLVCIAQHLKDLSRQSEATDSVLKNCHTKLILRQDSCDLQLLKETLNLSDAEITSVEHFSNDEDKRRDSQCLLIVGCVHGTVRLVPSPMDYWICTTEATHDLPKRAEMMEEVRKKNPRLSATDTARQSVYYLGVNHES